MARAFADITFTESVKAAQLRYGSREQNRGFELAENPRNLLTETEAHFIQNRDSFYQATVGENGWPYVQHRGGPIGFLKVIDAQRIAYADYSGNRQYISVGNMNADSRVSLILMDYTHQRRLKLWGHAHVVHESDSPELFSAVIDQNYSARNERLVVIHIEAIEWNCPQHITPRFTEKEVRQFTQHLIDENTQLKEQLAAHQQRGHHHD